MLQVFGSSLIQLKEPMPYIWNSISQKKLSLISVSNNFHQTKLLQVLVDQRSRWKNIKSNTEVREEKLRDICITNIFLLRTMLTVKPLLIKWNLKRISTDSIMRPMKSNILRDTTTVMLIFLRLFREDIS